MVGGGVPVGGRPLALAVTAEVERHHAAVGADTEGYGVPVPRVAGHAVEAHQNRPLAPEIEPVDPVARGAGQEDMSYFGSLERHGGGAPGKAAACGPGLEEGTENRVANPPTGPVGQTRTKEKT